MEKLVCAARSIRNEINKMCLSRDNVLGDLVHPQSSSQFSLDGSVGKEFQRFYKTSQKRKYRQTSWLCLENLPNVGRIKVFSTLIS